MEGRRKKSVKGGPSGVGGGGKGYLALRAKYGCFFFKMSLPLGYPHAKFQNNLVILN